MEGGDNRATLVGGFVEPRYVFSTSSGVAFPYLSGRFYAVRPHERGRRLRYEADLDGFAANGGGGVLIRAGQRVNIDLGATYGYIKFNDFTFENRSTGIKGTSEGNNGTNFVVRAGLTYGF